jgi:diguanylate cyclase (GGDEF)-like protein
MFLRDLFKDRKPDPSKLTGSYQDSLINVTKAGTIITSVFFLLFAFVYLFGGYPHLAVWVNLIATLCSLLGYVFITRYYRYRSTAHLVTFAIYLSAAGVMVISGGIQSSSAIWLVFVPVAAFIMAGLRAGLRWGAVSFLTVLVFFLLNSTELLNRAMGFEITTTDRIIDLGGAIIAVSIAIWYSDLLKSRSLVELEETKTKLKYYANIDLLTNIFNRRHFLELSERMIKRPFTSNGHASFLLFDIDHFKKINDQYGHLIGDQVLHGLAQTCMKNLRTDDVLGRYGGEEFVILLPETKLEDAKFIAERLRLLVAETPIKTEIGLIHTTISIGVATRGKASRLTTDQLLSRADRAMYRAKQAGRNRVIAWDERDLQTT